METMEKTARLMAQLHHHYYLAVLHQPYILKILRQRPTTWNTASISNTSDYTYNQTAALSASRDLLSCFKILRSFHQVLSYRPLDDKAFTAATIILLIHIDGHRLGRENVIERQRPRDLGLVSDVINSIKETSRWNQDRLSRHSIQTLERLVEIEANTADGVVWYMWMEAGSMEEQNDQNSKREQGIRLQIPYFGFLCIANQRPSTAHTTNTTLGSIEMTIPTSLSSTMSEHTNAIAMDWGCIPTTTLSAPKSQLSRPAPLLVPPDIDSSLTWPSSTDHSLVPRELSPLVQSTDEQDWLYQDIDPAFFEGWIPEQTLSQEDEVD